MGLRPGSWQMLRRFLKAAALGLTVLAVAVSVLYAVGFRVVLDGGGTPHVRLVQSAAKHAEEIGRHREAQRAQSPPAALPNPPVAPAPEPARAISTGTTPPVADRGTAAAPTDRGPVPYWTDFRGPLRDGRYTERPIATSWPSSGLRPLWKLPVGGGYASIVAARGRIFTIEQRGTEEVVAAYDLRTGRELWTNTWTATFRESMGGDGPRATPTWSGGRVFALGGLGELRCLDEATGRTLWRTNILEEAGAQNLQWGMAASPLVVDDTVVVLPGGPRGRSIVAYDTHTGKRKWSSLDDQQAYSSPMLVTLAGIRQIVVFSASRVMGVTPEAGEVLWEYPWKTQFDVNASQPIVIGERRLFVSSGYGTGAAVVELTPAGRGLTVREVWRNIRMKNQFTSSVLHDGYVYGLDESILACLDAGTGALKWKGGRYGYGQILLASGHIIVLTESGELALVRATPERHEELVRFPVLEGKTWNHPAMAEGYLIVRNVNEMAAFDLRPPSR